MPLRVEISPRARREIASWRLPDYLLVEVYLRLSGELANNPKELLQRVQSPFEGMCYRFSLIDPRNRFCEHRFLFPVFFSQDEERLIIQNAGYTRHQGV